MVQASPKAKASKVNVILLLKIPVIKVQPQKVDKSASILQRVNFSRNKNIESSITKTGAVYKSSTAIEIELLSIERK